MGSGVDGEDVFSFLSDEADAREQFAYLTKLGYRREALEGFLFLREKFAELRVQDEGRLGVLSSRNLVRAVSGGRVFKLSVVTEGEEVGSLLRWEDAGLAGRVTPRVYAHGREANGWEWSLQERFHGTMMRMEDSAGYAVEAARVANLFHLPLDGQEKNSLPSLHNLLRGRVNEYAGREDDGEVSRWGKIVGELYVESGDRESVLCHGDYGYNNILLLEGSGELRVIDPKGYAGPPYADVAKFLAHSLPYAEPDVFCSLMERVAGENEWDESRFQVQVMVELVGSLDWAVSGYGDKRNVDSIEKLLTVLDRNLL